MKIPIFDLYNNFFESLYFCHPNVELLDFESHRFGTSNAYSFNLNKLGCQAQEIVINDASLKIIWARKNNSYALPLPRYLNNGLKHSLDYNWRYRIIKDQIEHVKSNVISIQERNIPSDAFLQSTICNGTIIRDCVLIEKINNKSWNLDEWTPFWPYLYMHIIMNKGEIID